MLPAIRQLMSISRHMVKNFKQKTDKCVINELNKSSDVIKLVTNSLVKCHRQAVAAVGDGQLTPATMVDGRYPHSDVSVKKRYIDVYLVCVMHYDINN